MALPRIFASAAAVAFRVVYRVGCLQHRRDEVLFLSRQSDEPSRNFRSLGDEFERRGWRAVYLTRHLTKKTFLPYAAHALRELWFLARCRVCILDRYDPVVGLLNFECEPIDGENASITPDVCHQEFPAQPVVIQLWHAFGAFKKFGFQSMDTPEGHPRQVAESYGIHRNYSWIICTGNRNRKAFAEAFSYPIERIVSLGLPEYDELLEIKNALGEVSIGDADTPSVLFAPTLRKSDSSPHPFKVLEKTWPNSRTAGLLSSTWSFHPLESENGASGCVSEKLLQATCVVTDYSSIVYEAYLLGRQVVFYTPDIEEYRDSPGLNTDPLKLSPGITFTLEQELVDFVCGLAAGIIEYPQEELERFVKGTFSECSPGVAGRIADFALDRVELAATSSR